MKSGFQSSAFWLSLAGLAVTAYLKSSVSSLSISVIIATYNFANAWVKKDQVPQ